MDGRARARVQPTLPQIQRRSFRGRLPGLDDGILIAGTRLAAGQLSSLTGTPTMGRAPANTPLPSSAIKRVGRCAGLRPNYRNDYAIAGRCSSRRPRRRRSIAVASVARSSRHGCSSSEVISSWPQSNSCLCRRLERACRIMTVASCRQGSSHGRDVAAPSWYC